MRKVNKGREKIKKMEKLVIAAPAGPMAVPAAYLVMNNKLIAVAEEIELMVWEKNDQLDTIITENQGDFVILPSNNAAVYYNNGIGVQLLDISVWNALYLISYDARVKSFTDLKGQKIVVPFKGGIPDLIVRYTAIQEGLDPFNDIDFQYVDHLPKAVHMLLAGEIDHAVLPEPLITSLLLQTKESKNPLYRILGFKTKWENAKGDKFKTAIAGTVALPSIQDRPWVIDTYLKQYELAVAWMLGNPEEAGMLVEDRLPYLGFKAEPFAASVPYITWEFMPAKDARKDIERFFSVLIELSPGFINGALPNDGFYYVDADLD